MKASEAIARLGGPEVQHDASGARFYLYSELGAVLGVGRDGRINSIRLGGGGLRIDENGNAW